MSLSRRHFLRTLAAGASVAGNPRFAFAQGKPITVAHSVSTFVYSQETLEKSPDLVQAYVNACYRAQQWIKKTKDEEIADLMHETYMDTVDRDTVRRSISYYKTIFDWDLAIEPKDFENAMKVFVPVAIDKPIPYAKAVEPSFLKKAHAQDKS